MSSGVPKFDLEADSDHRRDTDPSEINPGHEIYLDRTSLKSPDIPSEFKSGVRTVERDQTMPDLSGAITLPIPMEEGENEVTEEFTRRMDVVEFPPEVRAAAAAFRLGIHTVLDEGGQEPVIDEEEGNRGED